MKKKLKLGDIYEIPLPNGKNAYGRLFKEYTLAIYCFDDDKILSCRAENWKLWRCLYMGLFKKKRAVFIENAGGVIITKSIYQGTSKLKWFFREESVNPSDNGWRAIGDNDTQEYLNNPENSMVVDFNTLANIEPAVLSVYDMPVGTDLEFCFDDTGRYFVDTNTGNRIK